MKQAIRRLMALVLCLSLLCGMMPAAFAAELKITAQPKNATAYAGEKVSASVTATGDGLTYQWYIAKKGSTSFSKSSITGKTYSMTMSETSDGRQAYCVVTDKNGKGIRTNTVTFSMRATLAVTAQPGSVTVKEGAVAAVGLAAIGDGLTYTWYYKDAGASKFSKTTSFTGTTYAVAMTNARDGRQVYCVVTDRYGTTLQTNIATLSMQHPAKITAQPKTAYAHEGKVAKTSVTATGDGLAYQWYIATATGTKFSKSSITSNTYSVKMSASNDGRKAYCIVTDKYGNSVKTNTVTLNMADAFAITKQPKDVRVKVGTTAKVTIAASGEGLSYEWYYKNAGATKFSKTTSFTGTAYSVAMDASRSGRQVYCVVTDITGAKLTTNMATLTMEDELAIVKDLQDVTVVPGEKAVVTVEAKGEGLTYTWYFKNAGAAKFSKTSSFTGPTYSIVMDESRNGRQVYCVVTDKYGESIKTGTATLEMNVALTIKKQPEDVVVKPGEKAVVTVEATGVGLTYTWYFRNPGAVNFSKTDSFKGSTYSLTMDESRNGRQVYCVVTDAEGNQVTTQPVTLYAVDPDAKVPAGLEYIIKNGEVTITGYGGGRTELTIPSHIKGKPVTAIGAEAFAGIDCHVTKITLPHTLLSIGDSAFSFSDLTTIILPPSLTTIGDEAFNNTKLTSITIPNSVCNMAEQAFIYCEKLTSVTVSAGLKMLPEQTFQGCTALKTVTIMGAMTEIGSNAFKDCTALQSITLPAGVTSIGYGAFKNCTALQHIHLPDGVSKIGFSAFEGCTSLKQIKLPAGVKTIENCLFEGCTSLTSVVIPESVTVIGQLAFKNCASLVDVTLPSGVTEIGSCAFWFCSSLKKLTLPQGITSIQPLLFADCPALESVNIPSGVTSIGYEAFHGCRSLQEVTIPKGVTTIEPYTFRGCESLRSLDIPDTVTTIGEWAFSGCINATSLHIPKGLKKINEYTFTDLWEVSEIVIPSGVTSIADNAFIQCLGLQKLTIPATVKTIGNNAFQRCYALKKVTIPSGVTKIGDYAFNECWDVTEISVPASVTNIGTAAFDATNVLKTVRVPKGSYAHRWFVEQGFDGKFATDFTITKQPEDTYVNIGEKATVSIVVEGEVASYTWYYKDKGATSFSKTTSFTGKTYSIEMTEARAGRQVYCMLTDANGFSVKTDVVTLNYAVAGLTYEEVVPFGPYMRITGYIGSGGALTIPSTINGLPVEEIGNGAFKNNNNLTSVVVPSSVTNIETDAFIGCTALKKVTLPEGLINLSTSFKGCTALTTINLPTTVGGYGSGMFMDCTALTSITVPGNISDICSYVFYNCSALKTVNILSGVTSISREAFRGCTSITSLTIPGTVTSIGEMAFACLESLEMLVLPSGVRSIGEMAFADNVSLTSLTIPASVTSIGADAFWNCPKLTVKCVKNSYAHTYCVENNIPFKLI